MTTVQLTLNLPDSLANAAGDAGLLTPEAIEALLREAVRRKVVDELFQKMDELADADFPPMTMEEIQAEVNAAGSHCPRRAGRSGR